MRASTAAFLVRAGFLVIWLPLDVGGFRLVLARDWHGDCLSMRTTGTPPLAADRCSLGGAQRSADDGQGACGLLYFAAVPLSGWELVRRVSVIGPGTVWSWQSAT